MILFSKSPKRAIYKSAIFGFAFLFCCLGINKTYAQKWQRGYFYDTKGNKEAGLIWANPGGKGPVKDEAFIEFREDSKATPYKMSAGNLRSYVVGRDSFVVAAEPQTSNWEYGVDFVRVVLDEDIKLYYFTGEGGNGGGGIHPEVGVGVGAGTGGYGSGVGAGVGAGIAIPIGHGGRGGNRAAFYYGPNTASMKLLTTANFVDIMSDIMGDEPDVVQQIQSNKYNLGNINKLIAYFEQVKASHGGQ